MKTIIITGANSGLGCACAKEILLTGNEYLIVMACRNPEKAEAAKNALTEETGNPNIRVMDLDLSSLQSVRDFAKTFVDEALPPLHAIVCNAGIAGIQGGQTADGYELVFGTNHLGHFLLTALLLPSVEDNGRVVVVSSDMHNPPGWALTWPGTAALANPDEQLAASPARYSYSKLCNVYFTYALARKLAKMRKPITVNAFNPGLLIETNLSAGNKHRFTKEHLDEVKDMIGSLPVSAKALEDMAIGPYFGEVTAQYCDRGEVKPSSELSYSTQNQDELWAASVKLSGLTKEETYSELVS